jgi:asparagine synthase (glutamine-hydrolysing)
LPESIVWRKNKFGFESPDRIWLSKYNDQMIKEINSNVLNYYCDMDVFSSKYKSMSLKDKWMYLNVSRWEKVLTYQYRKINFKC